jgi:hypothetical protein
MLRTAAIIQSRRQRVLIAPVLDLGDLRLGLPLQLLDRSLTIEMRGRQFFP